MILGQLSNIDIRLLRVFRQIVESGGLSAAELQLNISRSVISRHLKDLETRLGGLELCRRGRAGFALTDEGQQHKREGIDRIYQVAQDECGVDRNTLHLGGSVYEAVVIDQESVRSLRAYLIPICLVTLLLTWACFRSVRLVVIVLAVGEFCRLLSLAIVYFTGGHINAVLIVLPVLVYVLTVSGAVHFVNYYRGAVRQHGPHGAA